MSNFIPVGGMKTTIWTQVCAIRPQSMLVIFIYIFPWPHSHLDTVEWTSLRLVVDAESNLSIFPCMNTLIFNGDNLSFSVYKGLFEKGQYYELFRQNSGCGCILLDSQSFGVIRVSDGESRKVKADGFLYIFALKLVVWYLIFHVGFSESLTVIFNCWKIQELPRL